MSPLTPIPPCSRNPLPEPPSLPVTLAESLRLRQLRRILLSGGPGAIPHGLPGTCLLSSGRGVCVCVSNCNLVAAQSMSTLAACCTHRISVEGIDCRACASPVLAYSAPRPSKDWPFIPQIRARALRALADSFNPSSSTTAAASLDWLKVPWWGNFGSETFNAARDAGLRTLAFGVLLALFRLPKHAARLANGGANVATTVMVCRIYSTWTQPMRRQRLWFGMGLQSALRALACSAPSSSRWDPRQRVCGL